MEKVQAFTRLQVEQIRLALKQADASISTLAKSTAGADLPIGIKEQVDAVGDRFLRLEKYVNLNFTGFRKILKKHDKHLPTPCSNFYIGRLHQQGWVRGDYSDIIVNISRIYALIRGDHAKEGQDMGGKQGFLRKTTKVDPALPLLNDPTITLATTVSSKEKSSNLFICSCPAKLDRRGGISLSRCLHWPILKR